jgi:hypothetical protein
MYATRMYVSYDVPRVRIRTYTCIMLLHSITRMRMSRVHVRTYMYVYVYKMYRISYVYSWLTYRVDSQIITKIVHRITEFACPKIECNFVKLFAEVCGGSFIRF